MYITGITHQHGWWIQDFQVNMSLKALWSPNGALRLLKGCVGHFIRRPSASAPSGLTDDIHLLRSPLLHHSDLQVLASACTNRKNHNCVEKMFRGLRCPCRGSNHSEDCHTYWCAGIVLSVDSSEIKICKNTFVDCCGGGGEGGIVIGNLYCDLKLPAGCS